MSSNTVNSFNPNEFSLSQSARDHFSSSLLGKDYAGIRLSVSESSGCSGYTYEIDYVTDKSSDDLVFTFDKISVFIDKNSFKFLKGTSCAEALNLLLCKLVNG